MLNHEASHALQHKTNPEFNNDLLTPDEDFGNKEERRVITTVEQETAIKHGEINEGEVTRKDHNSGFIMDMPNPTSTENATYRTDLLEEVEIIFKKV